jgi:murein hydrolase activator
VRRGLIAFVALASLGGGLAAASVAGDVDALALAKRQAAEAARRSAALEREAGEATSRAARARAESEAIVARIERAEADISAAEARLRIIETRRAEQRRRLAERQAPVVRLTAALQMIGRRPPALALVRPGSTDEIVHIRSLLASTLPIVRERTAALREEIARGEQLREQASVAVEALADSRRNLQRQRMALARLAEMQRARSEELGESALFESDRALAFDEQAREISEEAGRDRRRAEVQARLMALPGPVLRPGGVEQRRDDLSLVYQMPLEGRLLRGMGEISDGGVHARGLTIAPEKAGQVVAPSRGRVAYAGRFRGYDRILIIDHGGGWTTTITNLEEVTVTEGDTVSRGQAVGRSGGRPKPVSVELRRNGLPFPIAVLLPLKAPQIAAR